MPRILNTRTCPHCKGALDQPTPRVCPHCGGSLQQRFFTAGCLSSAPPVILLALGAAWSAHAWNVRPVADETRAHDTSNAHVARSADEHVAKPARRP